MKKYLYDYIKEIDDKIKNSDITNEDIQKHLIKISFFQHERLIHLLVTITYALMFFMSLVIALGNCLFCIIVLILACFLVPYVRHYFKLENGIQYLYKQYDMMMKL